MNGLGESWLSTLRNQLSIIITPHRKWQWTVSAEHYRNELTAHNFKNVLMLDTGISFRLNKRIELASSLTNILNRRSYNYTAYSELSSFESKQHETVCKVVDAVAHIGCMCLVAHHKSFLRLRYYGCRHKIVIVCFIF